MVPNIQYYIPLQYDKWFVGRSRAAASVTNASMRVVEIWLSTTIIGHAIWPLITSKEPKKPYNIILPPQINPKSANTLS